MALTQRFRRVESTPAVSTTPPSRKKTGKKPPQPLTPYETRLKAEKIAREKRHLRAEQQLQILAAQREAQEIAEANAARERRKARQARELQRQAAEERREKRQAEEHRRMVERLRESQRQQLQANLLKRKNCMRTETLYNHLSVKALTPPARIGNLQTRVTLSWLPERHEVEIETELGPAFVPLAALLGGDTTLCERLAALASSMTLSERGELLAHCLTCLHFHSTPPAVRLLEVLHNQLNREAKSLPGLQQWLQPLTSQLAWRQLRCAEKYGYRAQELAHATSVRATALLGKGSRNDGNYSQTLTAHREYEWGSEWGTDGGLTRFNPFEYK